MPKLGGKQRTAPAACQHALCDVVKQAVLCGSKAKGGLGLYQHHSAAADEPAGTTRPAEASLPGQNDAHEMMVCCAPVSAASDPTS